MTKKIKNIFTYSLLIIPVVICFIASIVLNFFYTQEIKQNRDTVLRQKQYMIDVLADEVKTSDSRLPRDVCKAYHLRVLRAGVENIDRQPHTLGILYDDSLKEISHRQYEIGVPSDKQVLITPTSSQEFVRTVLHNQQGFMNFEYQAGKNVTLFYRWVRPDCGDSVLLTTAVTDRTISEGVGRMALINTVLISTLIISYLVTLIKIGKQWNL